MDNEKDNLPLFDGQEPPRQTPQPPPVEDESAPVPEFPAGFEEEIHEAPAAAAPAMQASDGQNRAGLHLQFSEVAGEGSFGGYLRELRRRNNLSIAQIVEETRIKTEYLEALEAEDYGRLPQPVYVLGYVRKLCNLYHVPADRVNSLTADLRERLEYELPEDISKSVVDRAVSEENERKLRQLMIFFSAGAVLIVAMLAVGGVLLFNNLRRQTPSVQGPVFEPSALVELQGRPRLSVTELNVP